MPPFWSGSCPTFIHKASETSGGPVTQTWPEVDYLSGRYHSVQSDSGGYIERQGLNPLVTSTLGICNQLEEISFNPFTLLRVPRLCDKFPRNEIIIAKGKNDPTHQVLQRPDSGKDCLGQNTSKTCWETDFISAGSSPSTPALQTLANVASARPASREELRGNGSTQSEQPERPPVVGGSDFHVEWSVDNYPSSRSDNNNGCIHAGMGSSLSRGSHKGTLDSAGVKLLSYQCLKTEGSIVCRESIHCQTKAASHSSENEQQVSSCLCVENGGDMILSVGGDSPGIVGLCSEQRNYSNSRISAWRIQSQGRLAVETLSGLQQLEIESQHIPDSGPAVRSTQDRSICRSPQCSTEELRFCIRYLWKRKEKPANLNRGYIFL